MEVIEMQPNEDRPDDLLRPLDPNPINETQIDFPEPPTTTEDLSKEAKIEEFISNIRIHRNINGELDKSIYRKLTIDNDGYISYNNKRVSVKRSRDILSVKTLEKSPDGREFLRKLGYYLQQTEEIIDRDLQTVSPEQSLSIKSKIDSFKVTENWANREREKAQKELLQATTLEEKTKMQDLINYYEHIEIKAKKQYNEVVNNQLRRINEIIHDETRSLSERLKELFRRDGLTIGAIITAIGMTISVIVLALTPTPNTPGGSSSNNSVKRILVKLSNWLLNLAKKALSALPGVIGSILSFLVQKTGELILFFSEHLILLILTVILLVSEYVFSKIQTKSKN